MASTTAFYSALSGMTVHARKLDVIGNNIANVNTTAYKQARLNLENRFSRDLGPGTAPLDTMGGTNPYQVGLGVGISGTQKIFTVGTISPTGNPRDLAIDGDGFFIVERDGDRFYTRNGAFALDADATLVTVNGETVQGYGVDSDYNVVEGTLGEISIPLGELQIAEATEKVDLAGNLNAGGDVASAGSVTRLLATSTAGYKDLNGNYASSS
ncbi:MAG TPA: flagellar hook-basal body complex protein, partial [Phycisphaerales bacterium]|nr:flagellar hook-basal body complex protein [Phycisphaerales bacterium]